MNEEEDFTVWIKPKEAAEILRVTPITLIRWDKEGKINSSRTPSGQRRYDLQDIKNHAGVYTPYNKKTQKHKVCYCRVSSQKQSDDLERQKDFFRHKYPNHHMVTDVGSGLNWKRKGLITILDRTFKGDIEEIVIAHKDRLCRFGYELLSYIFEKHGVKLVVLNDETKNTQEEFVDNIIAIITVFSNRYYGKRKYSSTIKKDKTISKS